MQKNNYIIRYIPNLVTLLCLASGFTSIRFSLNGEWKIAIYLILLASIFDFFDGWFARKLKGDSNFGAELDSLSDVISRIFLGLEIIVSPPITFCPFETKTLFDFGKYKSTRLPNFIIPIRSPFFKS